MLSAGSWQSLEVFSLGRFHVAFSDIDSFVRETKHFLLSAAAVDMQGMNTLFMEACSGQAVPCYEQQALYTPKQGGPFKHIVLCSKQAAADGC